MSWIINNPGHFEIQYEFRYLPGSVEEQDHQLNSELNEFAKTFFILSL